MKHQCELNAPIITFALRSGCPDVSSLLFLKVFAVIRLHSVDPYISWTIMPSDQKNWTDSMSLFAMEMKMYLG